MDWGKHERSLEHETILDKAAHGYAERLDGQVTRVQAQQQLKGSTTVRNSPALSMGWALKSPSKRSRFSVKQKEYLKSKFDIGEITGRKVSAASLAKAMMTARDNNGCRLFTSAEFLTSQQISGFFSRQAAKRTLKDDLDEVDDFDEESESLEAEKIISQIRDDVMNEIVPKHPICYDNHNLCELQKKNQSFPLLG